jgi:ribosomal protein S18 acetylase RimI-like enzyme
MTRVYPSESAGPFDPPPKSFEDRADRDVSIHTYSENYFDPLIEMYVAFDSQDRAQGIPPTNEERTRNWLDNILTDDAVNVIARTDNRIVGHATLVPDGESEYELAIFVLDKYQESGIGTELITALLGSGAKQGIEYVWLSVERWNAAARALYRKVGFEPSKTESFEFEMSIRL